MNSAILTYSYRAYKLIKTGNSVQRGRSVSHLNTFIFSDYVTRRGRILKEKEKILFFKRLLKGELFFAFLVLTMNYIHNFTELESDSKQKN